MQRGLELGPGIWIAIRGGGNNHADSNFGQSARTSSGARLRWAFKEKDALVHDMSTELAIEEKLTPQKKCPYM